jgi:hypothetical protein
VSPLICYTEKNFRPETLSVIETANQIIAEYAGQGFTLTLRQLYYQFVARGLVPNTERSYKRLGSIVNDARVAGLIDWIAIEDRTRWLRTLSHWGNPGEIVEACAQQYRIDLWGAQDYRPEVWIEKDALVGVIEEVCEELDVPYFACRGYVSQSEQWRAGVRHRRWAQRHQKAVVFHLGDHDPSGIDMTRDNHDRLDLFSRASGIDVRRLALNMDQVQQYNPPPNPTKLTDARAAGYLAEYGDESWELDALEPQVIADLIRENIEGLIDQDRWDDAQARQEAGRDRLREVAEELEEEQRDA